MEDMESRDIVAGAAYMGQVVEEGEVAWVGMVAGVVEQH
jgi:hypothetical protein